jgi:2-(1,2-epoxy-1,2-dihydrophenyl)acetyl-CoA isomerase
MDELIIHERVDETATLTLNDPDRRNALSVEMANQLRDAIADIEDSDARCVVVQGTGSTFCSGGDIKSMLNDASSDVPVEKHIEESAIPVNRAVQAIAECSLPTVAKVDGPAIGAGAALAIANDVVLASERAKISFGFRQVGLSVDSGTSALLPRIVGENVAKELVYTGELLNAQKASDLGLFNRVFLTEEFEKGTEEIIDQIATGPTIALKRSKKLLESGRHRSLDEAIDAETDALETTLTTSDHEEGVTAFVEQRDPDFEGK